MFLRSRTSMRRVGGLWMWLLAVSLSHAADARVTGSTIEVALASGIVSPLLSTDRDEVDVLLNFVGEPPLPTTSIDRKSRSQSTDSFVNTVLGAYTGVLDETARRSFKRKNHDSLLSKAARALWARQVVNRALRCIEPVSTRKTLMRHIAKNFLSEESLPALGNAWLERLEDVLCNCYNNIVRTLADDTSCHECRSIPGAVVFSFLVEDLLTDVMASEHETYINHAVGRLQERCTILNRKRSAWEALINTKQNMNSAKKVLVEDKKESKQRLLSGKPLVAAVWSDTLIGGDEKSTWKPSPSQFPGKGKEKHSIPSNYERAYSEHATRRTELSPPEGYYEEVYGEPVHLELGTLEPEYRDSEVAPASRDMRRGALSESMPGIGRSVRTTDAARNSGRKARATSAIDEVRMVLERVTALADEVSPSMGQEAADASPSLARSDDAADDSDDGAAATLGQLAMWLKVGADLIKGLITTS